MTAGHLFGGIGAEIFAKKYRDNLLKKVIVDVNLEHMCAKEVEEDPETHNYRFTNNLALGAIFLSHDETLVTHTIKAVKDHSVENMILIPENFFNTPPIGEAAPPHSIVRLKDGETLHPTTGRFPFCSWHGRAVCRNSRLAEHIAVVQSPRVFSLLLLVVLP